MGTAKVFKGMRIFVTAVECGSLSGAGESLGMAASSVSRRLDRLEHELNATLLNRSTRSLTLTDAGRVFFAEAKRILGEVEDLSLRLGAPDSEPEGWVRVSVLESFGRTRIAPLIPRFLERYPKVKVEIDLNNQLADLHRERFDIAIRIGRPADSRLKMRSLIRNEMQVCAAPAYLQAHGVPDTPEALRKHNCLQPGRARDTYCWYFKRGEEHRKVPVSGNLVSVGGAPLLEAACQGLGIVMLAGWMLEEAIAGDRLKVILPDWQPSLDEGAQSRVYALFADDRHRRPAVRAFIDFLAAHFNSEATHGAPAPQSTVHE